MKIPKWLTIDGDIYVDAYIDTLFVDAINDLKDEGDVSVKSDTKLNDASDTYKEKQDQ